MPSITRSALLAVAVLGCLAFTSSYAADPATTAADTPKVARDNPTQTPLDNPKAKAPKAGAPKVAKLGGGYDTLDLTDDQKADILKIRAGIKDDLAKLKAEIQKIQDDAKAKEVALLTPDQQAKLKTFEADAAASKKGNAAKDTATAPTTKPKTDAPVVP